jgi:asparagine synthetase B (glutamine-hydrolysing)
LRLTEQSVATLGETEFSWGRKLASDPARRADGAYLSWKWDGATLEVQSHPLGFIPVYYWLQPDRISVSTSIGGLLESGAPADLDYSALSLFLHLGFFVGEDTPFRAIRALPASGRLLWRGGQISFPDPIPSSPPAAKLDRRDALHEYARLFRLAIARREPRGLFGVPLSGGRDSRHILLELISQGHRPTFCITAKPFLPKSTDDVRIATKLVQALNVPHVVVDQPQWRLPAEIAKNHQTSFCSDEHTWMMPVVAGLAGKVNEVYDGIGGDILSAGLFLVEPTLRAYREQCYHEVARSLLSRWFIPEAEPTLRSILVPSLREEFSRESAEQRLIAELGKFSEWHNPLTAFYFFNRTRREISLYTFSMLMNSTNVLCPYLDTDVMNFLMSLPAEVLLDHNFHSDTVAIAYPDYQHIGYAEYTHQQHGSRHRNYWRRFSIELLLYIIRERGNRMVNIGWLVPRLIANTLLGRQFSAPLRAQYLVQLGRTCDLSIAAARSMNTSGALAGSIVADRKTSWGT